MNILYFVVIGLAFVPKLGPTCHSDDLYPLVLTLTQGLFIINALMHHFVHHKGYWLKWELDPECAAMIGNEKEHGFEDILLKKKVFTAQMSAYIKTQTILAIVMCLIQFFARVVINYSPFLACDLHGKAWL